MRTSPNFDHYHFIPWPLELRRVIDRVAIVFAQAYMLARARATDHSFKMVRLMAERDHAVLEARLLRRELEVLRRNRENILPPRDLAPLVGQF